MVTHPIAESAGVWSACADGSAVRSAEAGNRSEYWVAALAHGALVDQLCTETYGQWGPAAVEELWRPRSCARGGQRLSQSRFAG
eukprot:3215450-Karenia_brevis.AAC.1